MGNPKIQQEYDGTYLPQYSYYEVPSLESQSSSFLIQAVMGLKGFGAGGAVVAQRRVGV